MQTFVSYAQNFEDVILWRALSDVENGFYVDVGAQHPLEGSVTRAFYERGWRGINIDPVPAWHGLLEVDRPDDVNLKVAAGIAGGEAVFYEVDGTGLSTMDARLAARYSAEGRLVRMNTVQVRTLDSILGEFSPAEIHFLKIDVEGAESDVLAGISLRRYRPWIVLVEATLPNTQEDVSLAWQALLDGAGYLPAYFDGLNRFFVAEERRDLLPRFASPPNYFDNFVRHSDWEMAELARRLSEERKSWLVEEASLKEELVASQHMLTKSQDQLAMLERSVKEDIAASQDQQAVREQSWREDLAASQEQLAMLALSHKEELKASQDQHAVREQSWKEELAASQKWGAELEDSLRRSERALGDIQAKYEDAVSRHAADLDTIDRLRQQHVSAAEEFRRQLERSHSTADWLASQLGQRSHVLERVLTSRSWKLTAPLRWLSSAVGAAHPLEQKSRHGAVPPMQSNDIDAAVSAERFVGVPSEQVLLDFASRKEPVVGEHMRQDASLPEPTTAPVSMSNRFDRLMNEATMMLAPPSMVPLRMRSLPAMGLFAPYVLRAYERLFRKQTLFNTKMIEALRILRDKND